MENKTNTDLRDLVVPTDVDNSLLQEAGMNAKSKVGRGVVRVVRITPWTDLGEDISEDGDLLD